MAPPPSGLAFRGLTLDLLERPILLLAVLAVLGCHDQPTEPALPDATQLTIVSGSGQTGPAGEELPDPLVVSATEDGGPLSGHIVNYVVTEGGGSVFAGTALTNDEGLAYEWWTLGAPGPQTVEVRATDPASGSKIVYGTFTATAIPTAPTEGLVAHWRFDEGSGATAADAVDAHDGTLMNGPTWSSGRINGGLWFDGLNDYVEVPDADGLDITGELTISAWINPLSLGENDQGRIVDKASEDGTVGYVFRLNTANGFGFQQHGRTPGVDSPSDAITPCTWQQVAVVVSGGTNVTLYVDGTSVETGALTAPIASNSKPLRIGMRHDGNRAFKGAIDEVRIYDRALSADEVSTLHEAEAAEPPSGGPCSRAYVTGTSGPLTVVASPAHQVVATVPLGNEVARGVAVTPDGSFAYVATSFREDVVVVVETSANSVAATIPVGSDPWGLAVTPDGLHAYVVNNGSNNVSVIETATNTVIATVGVGSNPTNVAVTPNGAVAYVTNWSSVSVINTATNTVSATISVPGPDVRGVAVSPDGALVYVVNSGSSTISVIATASNSVVGTIAGLGAAPVELALMPDGLRAYVTNFSAETTGNSVSVVNTVTRTVIATIPVGSNPGGVAVSPDGAFAYVANQADQTVSVISTASNTVVASIGPLSGANGVAFSPTH